jgi:hypothetical protein
MAHHLPKLMSELYEAVEGFVQRAFDAANERTAALEKRFGELPAGPRGERGEKGDAVVGEKGEPGAAGKDGANGKDGLDGKNGEPGKDGAAGADGKPGVDGINGKDGAIGRDGTPGADGVNGKDGAPGKDGRDGVDGLKGADGVNGKDGERGVDGVNGKDADPKAIEEAVLRALETRIALEVMAKVEAAMARIPKPENGRDGKDGVTGTKGESGRDGRDGKDGKDGRDGVNGEDGIPGKDAAKIEILPAIDPARSYPRGTFARHAKGLWHAATNTHEMRGWECLVAGFDDFDVEQTEERKFKFAARLSDGQAFVKEFALPVSLYRGVFKPGTEYFRGDEVTWGGSKWHCLAERTFEQPQTLGCKDWVLSVKRGDPGKDLRPESSKAFSK